MTRAQRILEEVRQLSTEERMDVLRGVVGLVEPSLSAEQESGIAEALDEADGGEMVDGPAALEAARRRARGGR